MLSKSLDELTHQCFPGSRFISIKAG